MSYFEEAKYIKRIMAYSPAQILMNNKNFNWELKEIQQQSSNPSTKRAIDLLLQMDFLYEANFSRVGAKDYINLPSEDEQRLKELTQLYNKEIVKAKNWCLNKAISENEIYYVEVYELLVSKCNKLQAEIAKANKKVVSGELVDSNIQQKVFKAEMYSYMIDRYNPKYAERLFED